MTTATPDFEQISLSSGINILGSSILVKGLRFSKLSINPFLFQCFVVIDFASITPCLNQTDTDSNFDLKL